MALYTICKLFCDLKEHRIVMIQGWNNKKVNLENSILTRNTISFTWYFHPLLMQFMHRCFNAWENMYYLVHMTVWYFVIHETTANAFTSNLEYGPLYSLFT